MRDGAIGLVMMSSKPTVEIRASSSSDTKPENARIETSVPRASRRSSPTSSKPSASGSMRSWSTTLGCSSFIRMRAVAPSGASITSWP